METEGPPRLDENVVTGPEEQQFRCHTNVTSSVRCVPLSFCVPTLTRSLLGRLQA